METNRPYNEVLLETRDIRKKEGENETLRGVSVQVRAHKKLALAGETGSGKTTLLKIMAGLIAPASGTVLFEGRRVKGPDERLIPGEPQIAYLSQQFEFPNQYRIEEILNFENKLPPEEASMLYQVCRIDGLMQRKNIEVSGGERQRIALARLLIRAPKLLLLDEPFSNLDAGHKAILKSVIHDIGERLKITCVLVSHDGMDVLSWASEIIVLQNGNIVQQDRPEEVYYHPANAYVAGLFGSYNRVTPKQLSLFNKFVKGDQLMRPEAFFLVPQSDYAVCGIVKRSHFFGGHYEIEIELDDDGSLLTVRSHKEVQKGTRVWISLRPD